MALPEVSPCGRSQTAKAVLCASLRFRRREREGNPLTQVQNVLQELHSQT